MHRSSEHTASSSALQALASASRVVSQAFTPGERAAESCSLKAARVALPRARPI